MVDHVADPSHARRKISRHLHYEHRVPKHEAAAAAVGVYPVGVRQQ